MEDVINKFMSLGSGWGDGWGAGFSSRDGWGFGDGFGVGCGSHDDGSGSGSGDVDGNGNGSGDVDGNGSGEGAVDDSGEGAVDCSGFGYGDVDGSGRCDSIIFYGTKKVYKVDGLNTIFYSIKGNIARCAIINRDLTLINCYVARSGDFFAHGNTAKEAALEANTKSLLNTPIEDRVRLFNIEFNKEEKYPATQFYNWHTILTGSCALGKDSFIMNNNIDMNSSFTRDEFVSIVKNAYGSDIIQLIK